MEKEVTYNLPEEYKSTDSSNNVVATHGHNSLTMDNHASSKINWVDGLFSSCMRPVLTIFTRTAGTDKLKGYSNNDWEIPFEMISDLQWLGSGAQGAVFSGLLNKEIVAVKKVREPCETEIRHLRKLNHENIVKFRGVCTQAPCYCIIMEYCPYGPLYDLLRAGERISPPRLVSWAKQIATGMAYLHAHHLIHRDLKSPNVLIGREEIVKISDFGTSRQWNQISTRMSFAGTVAWMAPEIIRNEPCSEKVDIWSYGVVLWELLSGEVPYKDVDSSAIIWGVGNNSLELPIPKTWPEGYALLVKLCWASKPRNRPSFRHIQGHLDIAAIEIMSKKNDDYFETQETWKEEIRDHMKKVQANNSYSDPINGSEYAANLIRQRESELRHAQDIREHYERKLAVTENLYLELNAAHMQMEQREQEIAKREQSGYKQSKKKIIHPFKLQERSYRRRNNNLAQQSNFSTSKVPSLLQNQPQNLTKCTQLNESRNVFETLVLSNPSSSFKFKKYRHRRVGSGGIAPLSPRLSPQRERKSAELALKYVDHQTQTDITSINESIKSIDLCCHSVSKGIQCSPPNFRSKCIKKNSHNVTDPGIYENRINLLLNLEPHKIRNNRSNGNGKLKDSDDDNLENLERKVSKIINANRLLSPATVNNRNCENLVNTNR